MDIALTSTSSLPRAGGGGRAQRPAGGGRAAGDDSATHVESVSCTSISVGDRCDGRDEVGEANRRVVALTSGLRRQAVLGASARRGHTWVLVVPSSRAVTMFSAAPTSSRHGSCARRVVGPFSTHTGGE